MEPHSQNQPTHYVYVVEDSTDDSAKNAWTKVGAAWLHDDGKGLSLKFDRLVVRERRGAVVDIDALPAPAES